MVLQRRENSRGEAGRASPVNKVQEGVEVYPAVIGQVSGEIRGKSGAK